MAATPFRRSLGIQTARDRRAVDARDPHALRPPQPGLPVAVRRADALHARRDGAVDRDRCPSTSRTCRSWPSAVTGYSSVLLWRNMPGRCVSAITPNLAPHVPPAREGDRHLRLAAAARGRAARRSPSSCSTLFFSTVGWMSLPEDILKVMGAWALLAWFGTALATAGGRAQRAHRSGREALASHRLHPVPALRARSSWSTGCHQRRRRSSCCCPWCTASSCSAKAGSAQRCARTTTSGTSSSCNLVLTLIALSQVAIRRTPR